MNPSQSTNPQFRSVVPGDRTGHDPSPSPGCPSSLENLVMTFHRAHSNSLRLALAINSGQSILDSVTFNARLAEYFQHVHASNSDPTALAATRNRLGDWHASNWWKAKFSFSLTGPEQMDECVVTGGTDIVTLFTNMHQMQNVEGVVRSAARSLAPNGTLAVVAFSPAYRVVDNEEVNGVVRRIFALWGEKTLVTHPEVLEKINSPLDYVPLPEGLFIQDVTKRIKINFWDRGNEAYVIPGEFNSTAEARVHPKHRLYEYNDGDLEGSGWRREADSAWFRGSISDLVEPHHLYSYEPLLLEIEEKLRTCSGSRVTVEWAAAVLLGTRK